MRQRKYRYPQTFAGVSYGWWHFTAPDYMTAQAMAGHRFPGAGAAERDACLEVHRGGRDDRDEDWYRASVVYRLAR